jgi:coniferyl-aldehyde dehydrogenase
MTRNLELQFPLTEWLARQRRAFEAQPFPARAERVAKLKRLRAALRKHQDLLCDAMSADYGGRSHSESKLIDVLGPVLEINHAISHLRRWMKPQRRSTELIFLSNRAWVEYQPKGVVGIIVPWNFPGYLALGPLVAALAAGNRAMIKMSEFTPHTTRALQTVLAECFPPEEVLVLGGDVEVGKVFAGLAFDHLVFTGSTGVGRQIMRAAADNLVPTTLELGGKSPAIVSRSGDLADAAHKIAHGKLLNCGQICVSPDYALVPRERVDEFVSAVRKAWQRMCPNPSHDPQYTNIVTDTHAQRIRALLKEAGEGGATVLPCAPDVADSRRIPLHLVLNMSDDMRIAREELFGPILPIVAYDDFDDALRYVVRRPRPLALYYFGRSGDESAHLRRQTHAGGMTINDCCWHVFQHDLPFGGLGASGMGTYHGEEGFRTLSHGKSVLKEHRFFPVKLFHPPYGNLVQRLVLRFYLGSASGR